MLQAVGRSYTRENRGGHAKDWTLCQRHYILKPTKETDMSDINNNINGGTISVEDGIKAKEEFAPARKVKVELSFSVPEGADGAAFMHGVARVADAKVASMLGRTAPAETVAPKAETPMPVAPKAETAAAKKKREAAEAEANKPAEKTKADLEREMLEAAGGDKTDARAAVVDEDDLSDVLGDAAPQARVISDKELGEIAGKINAKKKAELGDKWAPAKIREVVATFTGKKLSDVPKITEVPADKRVEFVAALEAL